MGEMMRYSSDVVVKCVCQRTLVMMVKWFAVRSQDARMGEGMRKKNS